MIKITKLITAFVALIMLSGTIHAQDLKFYKKYRANEVNFSEQIRVSHDNKLLLLGTIRRTNSLGQNIRDMLLVKTNFNGDTLWTKYVGLDSRSELGRDFEILPNGNMLLTGYSIYDNGTKVKGFLMCVDTAGSLLWDKYYGSDTAEWAFSSIKVVSDGIVLAGTTGDTDHSDALILKTSMSGDSLWSTTVGGDEYDDAWDVEAAEDGGYLFTGGTYSFADGDFDDAWIVKLDADGNYLWKKTFGLPGRVDWSWAFVPSRNSSGAVDGYVFTGVKNAGEEGTQGSLYGDVHFVKVSLDGDLVWDKSMTTPSGQMRREGTDIIRTIDGGYAICGYRLYANKASLYFIKTDGAGNIEYETITDNVAETFLPRALVQVSDSSFYITGTIAAGGAAPLEIFLAHIGPATTTAIEGRSLSESLDIYPNPAKEHIIIHNSSQTAISQIDIMSVDGRRLKTIPVQGKDDLVIPVSAYAGNNIFLRIRNKDGYCYYKKIVVL